MKTTWKGTYTALVTPFQADGAIDEPALRGLVDRQIAGGVDGIVPCGTTGESATLHADEKLRVVEIVTEQTDGRVAVLAGAGGNSTHDVIALAQRMAAARVDGILSVVPYYNKPTQGGLYSHFAAIADAVQAPVVLYNVPGRTAVNLAADTVLRLAEHGNIVGVKEASGDFPQVMQIIQGAPQGFHVLSGEDSLTLPIIALGGHGVVSVVANELPDLMSDMVRAALAGDFSSARELHYKLLRLMDANFIETNPIPAKAALAMMGLIGEHYRLPMVPITDASRETLRADLIALELLEPQ
ncbi:MAG: 4-hydroxy-tetrahydrodipicolinate synthase [Gemmatimonadetes bacterium]|nr:4-hydroxy-tetrahydrodipicolinate synthase [Gemmatimonadota bacterium]